MSVSQQPLPVTLPEWLDYLMQGHVTAIDLGLERVLPVAEQLEVVRPDVPVITVAGTNGKGSTSTLIACMLQAAGYRVGLYQSPHIFQFNERVKINQQPVSDEKLTAAFSVVERARHQTGLTLSFFEATTLAAFHIFKQQACEVWVLEVGLGGRLDVVNVVDPSVAVITNIGLDHTEWLGPDRESIGREKAGILRPGIPLIYGDADMPDTIRARAEELGCPIWQAGRDFFAFPQSAPAADIPNGTPLRTQSSGQWHYSASGVTLALPMPSLALENAATAVTAILASGLVHNHRSIAHGLSDAQLWGRFQRLSYHGHLVIMDAAHNPHGMAFLTTQLSQALAPRTSASRSLRVVFSMLGDKDIAGVMSILAPWVQKWYLSALTVPRAATLEQLGSALQAADPDAIIEMAATPLEAFHAAIAEQQPDETLLVCGSFHTLEALWGELSHHG